MNEIIVKCGVDGGSWTLVGKRGARGGWRFRASRDEGTLRDFIDDKDWATDRHSSRISRNPPRSGSGLGYHNDGNHIHQAATWLQACVSHITLFAPESYIMAGFRRPTRRRFIQ